MTDKYKEKALAPIRSALREWAFANASGVGTRIHHAWSLVETVPDQYKEDAVTMIQDVITSASVK